MNPLLAQIETFKAKAAAIIAADNTITSVTFDVRDVAVNELNEAATILNTSTTYSDALKRLMLCQCPTNCVIFFFSKVVKAKEVYVFEEIENGTQEAEDAERWSDQQAERQLQEHENY